MDESGKRGRKTPPEVKAEVRVMDLMTTLRSILIKTRDRGDREQIFLIRFAMHKLVKAILELDFMLEKDAREYYLAMSYRTPEEIAEAEAEEDEEDGGEPA